MMKHPAPIIDCTDLYHPHQDPGDNVDILAAYALPEVDLRAVILDITEVMRQSPEERRAIDPNLANGDSGCRDPGFIPVTQCNSLFNRNVPAAVSPYRPLRATDDAARDAPGFQQAGIDLLLRTLREAEQPVEVLSFGSCRVIAAAFNREPELLRRKVGRLHLSAGTSTGAVFDMDWPRRRGVPPAPGSVGFIEWNVALDPHAFVCLMRSGLPLALYPCASENGPFDLGRHNTYYALDAMEWALDLEPRLRNYLAYVFTKSQRSDFLRALEGPCPPPAEALFRTHKRHNVWETAVWLEVSGRKLVRRADGSARIVRAADLLSGDRVVAGEQRHCLLTRVDDTGRFAFELCSEPTGVTIFDRGDDGAAYQTAAREAFPEWYREFRP